MVSHVNSETKLQNGIVFNNFESELKTELVSYIFSESSFCVNSETKMQNGIIFEDFESDLKTELVSYVISETSFFC